MGFKHAEYGKFWRKIGSESYEVMYQARPLLHDNFKNFLRNKKDVKTVLEVGCGTGIYPIKFKELFFNMEYEGIDFAKPAIEYCRNNSQFNFICGDFIKMKLQKKYDLVFSHAVIDHVYDIEGFLSKIVEVCKKYAYVSSFKGYFPNIQKHLMQWKEDTGSYQNNLSVEETKRNLLKCGLDEDEFVIRKQKSGNLKDSIVDETVIEINRIFQKP